MISNAQAHHLFPSHARTERVFFILDYRSYEVPCVSAILAVLNDVLYIAMRTNEYGK